MLHRRYVVTSNNLVKASPVTSFTGMSYYRPSLCIKNRRSLYDSFASFDSARVGRCDYSMRVEIVRFFCFTMRRVRNIDRCLPTVISSPMGSNRIDPISAALKNTSDRCNSRNIRMNQLIKNDKIFSIKRDERTMLNYDWLDGTFHLNDAFSIPIVSEWKAGARIFISVFLFSSHFHVDFSRFSQGRSPLSRSSRVTNFVYLINDRLFPLLLYELSRETRSLRTVKCQ